MRSIIPGIVAVFVTLLAASTAGAADPQSYAVELGSTGNGTIDGTLRSTSELLSLRTTAPVSPFGLIARARGEIDRLKTVLESYGYYQSSVTIAIDGMPLNGSGLADHLTALPKDTQAKVAIGFELGPLYHIGRVTIEGTIPGAEGGAFTLKTGAPAVANDVLGAGARLSNELQEHGYAFAKVDPPVAYEDRTEPLLDVTFHIEAGPQVNFGEIHLEGLKRLHDKLIRRRLTIHTGQRFSASAVEAARRDLFGITPLGAVTVRVGKAVDSTGGVPVTFSFRERPRHAVTFNSAYSTDLGASAGVTWTDRNVFGNAEQLAVKASAIDIGGSAATSLGYDLGATFTIPDYLRRDQSLQFSVEALKQSLIAYQQKAVTGAVTLTRKLSSVWSASAGVSATKEQIQQEMVTYDYTLVALPLTLAYDSTHLASPLDDPTHGMRNLLSVTPTRSLGHPDASFIVSQIKLASYLDMHSFGLGDPGRSVLALRALAGIAEGATEFSLPPDQRFYAGGSGTIRGFQYQAVGPQFADGTPKGGTSYAAGTVEWRQRFGASWGAAVFVDGGEVSGGQAAVAQAGNKPVRSCQFCLGVGAGARYYTPIGPLRVDIAVPTRHYGSSEPGFEIYIGLGQAF